uniref:Reverse transcriptase domain-containing protein n=1 Tax=Tanacetum cinerariifolium TaxID=118510 RepID=A0A6L2LU82_TANCI|nr:reverse transcriptase domain-containing protein [Tanacetum cinerariifolium]
MDSDVMLIKLIKDNEYPSNDKLNMDDDVGEVEFKGNHFDNFPTRSELAYQKYLMHDPYLFEIDPKSPSGLKNFMGRAKGMHIFIGNFTYVSDFMIIEYISSVIDPRVSYVILGKPFVELSAMTYDSSLGLNEENEDIKWIYLRTEEDKKKGVKRTPNVVEPELRTIVAPIADNRTMEELLQAPTEGYGEAIVISKINADHFEIKTNLLQLVQANPYHGFERENPHTHINNFKRITSTLKFRGVPNDVIKLMMFPYLLEGNARVWYDKEPPSSILTWEDLVNKFVNQFFPPLKTTHLKNEISRFTQRFEETYKEACERFKKMLRACPHHGFTELAQIDTFYNGLNDNDQDSLNATMGGNLLSKTTREALQIIENKSKLFQQGFSNEFLSYKKANEQIMRNIQSQINSLKEEFKNEIQNTIKTQQTVLMEQQNAFQNNLQNMLSGFFQNQSSALGTLSSNTIPNPKGEMKAITTRSGVSYEGPSIPTPKKVVERETGETTDKEQTNIQGSTTHIQPPVTLILEPDVPKTLPKPNIPYLSRLNDQKLREKATNQMEKLFQIFQDLHFDISFADALLLMPKFASTIKSLLTNKDKLFELAKIPLNE